jgi:RNA polymerase sigma-70 factor (ECF subfamily)
MTTNVVDGTQQPLPDMSDEYLVQQFIRGDEKAFDILYHRYVKKVYNRVRYLAPETDVEDITQEVFIAVIRSLPSFRGEAKFSTWLRTLTNNKVNENFRKRSRKKETMQVDLEHAERSSDHSNASSMEDIITVQHALKNIPNQYRGIILLRFAEGMTFKEIAENLNKNLESTKSLYRRAISALKEVLEMENE